MRISLCNEVVRDLDFPAQCALAAGLGYDGLEVAPFTLDAEAPHLLPASRRAELRRAAAEAGTTITSLHWLLVAPAGLSITTAEPAIRARTLDVMERLVALTADLGGALLVHGSPGQRRVETDGDAARAEEAMARAGEWAAQHGVTYCLEPLDPGQTNWVTNVAEAAAIVRRIGNPALRTMLDVCSAGNGESEAVPALLERFIPTGDVAHVHLNDRNRRGPGQGKDRFGPVLSTLRRVGYGGFCAVEPFDYVPDGPTSAARAIGYLRGLEEMMA
ncbi:sugar phosphate isomerase/epimerase [Roseomonas eburnea]|uniref:Sugar phosphate isomerase/epimerase n=1 Tax=Neoroseomonas eburnea TaxID=1346889 RepID=A0A9X9XC31_9PROT|nr:sugar phosphate isomerase/epimerase family protein [Neoroseomonas eburnea]MBR0681267.1 sugar phosphate isomerase/epimerase [Neoroseomonas eburnea]